MQAADTVKQIPSENPTPLPFRDDTILGVCTALGEDFGISSNLLRILVGVLVLVDIKIAVAVYLGLGVAVALGRLLFPPRREPVAAAAGEQAAEANDAAAAPEKLAAEPRGPLALQFSRLLLYPSGYQSQTDGLKALCGTSFLLELLLAKGPNERPIREGTTRCQQAP